MRTFFSLLAGVFFLSSLLSACDWVEDEHEEHTEAEGFRLVVDGVDSVVVREQGTTGLLQLGVGAEMQVLVRFTDADGQIIPSERIEEESLLSVDVADERVVELHTDTSDPWVFRLEGKEAGTTEINVGLKHGDHDDLKPKEVTVEVIP